MASQRTVKNILQPLRDKNTLYYDLALFLLANGVYATENYTRMSLEDRREVMESDMENGLKYKYNNLEGFNNESFKRTVKRNGWDDAVRRVIELREQHPSKALKEILV